MGLPIRIIPSKTNFNFIKYKSFALLFSLLITIAAIGLVLVKGLNFGIDFSGGIVMELKVSEDVTVDNIRSSLTKYGYGGALIQEVGNGGNIMVRIQPKDASSSQVEEVKKIQEILTSTVSTQMEFRKVDYVGPKVGGEFVMNGALALIVAIIGMLLYIWFRFDWQFGLGAVISLAHDAVITLGFFSISQYDFDLTSIAAILTIVGYSINDTVVIYDRIRENLRKHRGDNMANIINLSINETLSRTIMTVATTLLVCLALALFGGEVLRGFSMALLFGIAFGTYSSIYVAAPILLHTGLKNTKNQY
ncbi:MAG: preprotein translocase subunit SecF [Candidatus Midichloriaceae bacterium]|jgi:preprotein translocase SecF subunit|nr:preprotein translocase subunit SecF [Candidatus Midichloriaceae bacterium]